MAAPKPGVVAKFLERLVGGDQVDLGHVAPLANAIGRALRLRRADVGAS